MVATTRLNGKVGALALLVAGLLVELALPGLGWGQDFQPAPAGASVKFGEPADGATVKSPFKVTMVVTGMQVEPAGTVKAGAGHHHIIVDTGSMAPGVVIPVNDTHLHFGQGQTEATLTLSPGNHLLTLQFADGAHRSYGSALSRTITVTVE